MATKLEWDAIQKTLIEYLKLDEKLVQKETNIYDNIGLDSLGVMGLGMRLQEKYKIKIPLSEVSSIKTLGDILDKLNQFAE